MGSFEEIHYAPIEIIANIGLAQLIPGCQGSCTFKCGTQLCEGGFVYNRIYKFVSTCYVYTGSENECLCNLNDPSGLTEIFIPLACPTEKYVSGEFVFPTSAIDYNLFIPG